MTRDKPGLPKSGRFILTAALWTFPRRFRTRFGPELLEFITEAHRDRTAPDGGRRSPEGFPPGLSFWIGTLGWLVVNGVGSRIDAWRRRGGRHRRVTQPSSGTGPGPVESLGSLLRSIRRVLRSLSRSPGFSLTTLSTLGLGVGACTWIFAVISPVLLSPLPYPEPKELVALYETSPGPEERRGWVSPLTYRDWEERTETLAGMANWRLNLFTWLGEDGPRMLRGWAVSHGFFSLLGEEMVLGRGFTAEEDRPGGPRVVVISHTLWTQSFGSDPEVLGQAMTLDGAVYTVVGIAGSDVEFPGTGDYWVPAATDFSREVRDFRYMGVFGRLGDGITLDEARVELGGIARQIAAENPDTNEGWGIELQGLKEDQVAGVRPILLGTAVAVSLLLLVALGNVTNLFLARSVGRRGDVAVRVALGAGRGGLARLFLAEAFLLAVPGAAVGLLLAHGGVTGVVALAGDRLPRGDQISLGLGSVAFSLGAALLFGTLLGLVSFLMATGRETATSLRTGGWVGLTSRRSHRLREGVLVVQVGLAMALLVGATLLARSLSSLTRVDVGFNPEGLMAFSWELPRFGYEEDDAKRAFQRDLLPRVEAIPGVEGAGMVTPLPLEMGSTPTSWTLAPGAGSPKSSLAMAHLRVTSPGYLRAMGLRLVAGRFIGHGDREDSEPVCVVNRSFVARYMGGADPLGARVTPGEADAPESDWLTVVGVVDDVRFTSLRMEGEPEIYLSGLYFPQGWGSLVIRSNRPSREVTEAVRDALGRVDPTLPLGGVRTGEKIIARQLATSRLSATLTAFFATTASALALVGILGVLSIVVAHRLREMGIRVAMGASPSEISNLVVLRGMAPVVSGLLLGLAISVPGTRLLGSQVYGVSLTDPLTFVLPSLGLALTGLLVCLFPARKARGADPVNLLRSE